MASDQRTLSLWQKLVMVPAIFQSLFQTLVSAVQYPFLNEGPRTFKRHVLLTMMREAFNRLSVHQLQFAFGSTESNYRTWTQQQGLPYRELWLDSVESKAFCIGDLKAENLVLYFHGGGFAMPATEAHFTVLQRLNEAVIASGHTCAGLMLSYDLAPDQRYPRQMVQCVELLRYALQTLKKSPDQIILGGDSSGGNLILSIFSHILHPHPSIDALTLATPLACAFLHSPVVKFGFDTERFRTNEIYEPAAVFTLRNWIKDYLGRSAKDTWNEPAQNGSGWWQGLEGVIDSLLITIATDEVMADDQNRVANKIKSAYAGLTVFSSKLDFHAEPGIGHAVGLEECEAAQYAKAWVVSRVQSSKDGML